ncbi:SDR family oxidoreductase [Alisedimentitalea sp. MJ-SS2]|uniref:SDR family oxidoreductase n=1 Tax=Aliisedimentitalea sp. MJ-SS2 TaxID=3049795 RepID=UPI0029134F74|nr:SDR family oxidoreductase [Alisedimentitalea sp. MJ-SS2]MDU8927914.1 SDR family oxidoreductase [Alisedimentitalea sp. MJ-SS2]
MTKTLFTFGHGYSATAFAKLLNPSEWRMFGTTRNPENMDLMRGVGVEPLQWPGEDVAKALGQATHLLLSIAPNDAGDPVLEEYGSNIAEMAPNLEWVGYLSTTGVYGDHQGGWVDESTALTPATRRGHQRVLAESQWQALDLPLHIFRLAGIYGPGRGPFAKVRRGTARRIIKENQVFSRIHVEDIAQVLLASIQQPNPGAIYNVCDNEAAPPQDVLSYAAELLGVELPPEEDYAAAEMTPMARSFYAESKRVRNDRIKQELGVELIYPSYRDGLDALLKQEDNAT